MSKVFVKKGSILLVMLIAVGVAGYKFVYPEVEIYRLKKQTSSFWNNLEVPPAQYKSENGDFHAAAQKYSDPNNIQDVPANVVVDDFVNIAFSNHLWLDDADPDEVKKAHEELRDDEGWISRGKWAEAYLSDANSTLHSQGLFRWQHSPSVTIGYSPTDFTLRLIKRYPLGKSLSELVQDVLGEDAPEIYAATGYSPSFSSTLGDGDIKIIFEDFPKSNLFKFSGYNQNAPYEVNLVNAVGFTPDARSQLSGYLLVGADNSIQAAVCHIWHHLPQKYVTSLLHECFVRAMGLPGMSQVFDSSVIGNWNKSAEPMSLTYKGTPEAYQKFKFRELYAYAAMRARKPDETFPYENVDLKTYWKLRDSELRQAAVGQKFPQKIDNYSRLLLSLLYANELGHGDDSKTLRSLLTPQLIQQKITHLSQDED